MHTRDYRDDDFLCRCGRCAWSRSGVSGVVAPALMAAVQAVRDVYGGPVQVVSGRRCASHNVELRGTSNDYHTRGLAADLVADDLSRLADAADVVAELAYIELRDDCVHVDVGKPRGQRRVDVRTVREVGA